MEPYPMKWFRLYDEALNDPKVQRLPDAAFKCWINLLCLANKGSPRGRINPNDIAYALRISDDRADKMVAYFLKQNLLDKEGDALVPHCWDDRQFTSDNVTERTRKHRGNVSSNVSSNVSGNVPKSLHGTPPDTEQNRTDTETEQNPPKSPDGGVTEMTEEELLFTRFWMLWPKGRGSKKLARDEWHKLRREDWSAVLQVLPQFIGCAEWQREGGKFVKHAERWLKYRGWEDDVPVYVPNGSANGKNNDISAAMALADEFRRQGL